VADLGMDVDSLIINILLAVAQKERELISNRVKEGMARAKVRGVTLGNPKLDKARLNSNKANRARGKRTLENYQEMILKAQKAGCVSTVDISNFLNFFGVKTTRGKDIYPSFVGRLLKKMK
jgi:DNA invertase Pin-like site-specific DNA recombinase